jgi:hypothetical protein
MQGKDGIKGKNKANGEGMEGVFFSSQAGIERPSLARWLPDTTVRCLWVILISVWNEERPPFPKWLKSTLSSHLIFLGRLVY